MAAKNHITQEELKLLLYYNPEIGIFIRLTNGNRFRAGEITGTINSKGYKVTVLNGKAYKAHRLAWLYIYGFIPENSQIDHINGKRDDNRIANLRLATNQENQHNQRKPRKDNTTGMLGAFLDKRTNKFCAAIGLDGKRKHIGTFNSAEEAHEAYLKVKREIHNFGTI